MWGREKQTESCTSFALIRWLTSVHSGTRKYGALQLTARLISRDSKQIPQQSWSSTLREHPLQPQTVHKGGSEEWKGTVAEQTSRGGNFRIDSPHVSAFDMYAGSCLLIMAQTYTIGGCCVTGSQEQSADCCVRRLVRQGPTMAPPPQLSPFSGSASSCLDCGGTEGTGGGSNGWKIKEGKGKRRK